MDEQLDNDLKNRIREVFENVENPSAEEGWLLLREKYPEKRRTFLWMWWSVAAILLLSLGIGLWFNNEKVKPEKFSYKKAVKHNQTESIATKPHSSNSNIANAPTHKNKVQTENNNKAQRANSYPLAIVPKSKANPNLQVEAKSPSKENPINNTFIAIPKVNSDTAVATKTSAKQLAVNVQPDITTTDSNKTLPKSQSAKTMASVFAQDQPEKAEKTIEKSKRVHFGVYAATYFNYAKGSNNQVNAGAGLGADIRLSKNLKLVTGVAIAQNSLNFSGGGPAPSLALFAVNAAPSLASAASPAYAYSVLTVKNYSANLVGIDIPINLKYEFNPQKNDIYISAGFSSGTFINQTYSYQYSPVSSLSASQQVETSNKAFNDFYFARTLNVAFGMGYPFGKNRLIIEPFLKYPLDGLGSQNIRFGAGGLNLKFNFQSPKK